MLCPLAQHFGAGPWLRRLSPGLFQPTPFYWRRRLVEVNRNTLKKFDEEIKDAKNKTKSPEIVDHFLIENSILWRNGEFLLFGESGYVKCSDALVRRMVILFIRREYSHSVGTAKMVTECLALLKDLTFCDVESLPFNLHSPGEIANLHKVANGVLDCTPMLKGEDPVLLPISKELVCIGGSKVDYDPSATCPKFDDFLDWFTSGDKEVADLLLEYLSLVLMLTFDAQRFLILEGSGSNGKSVLLKMLIDLFGEENCAALGFERFGGRFNLAGLVDKTINISGDANEVSKVAEGVIKQLVDRSSQTFEKKHKDVFEARCFARFIFATNVMPRWRDRTDGLWRRMIIIPCHAYVTGKDVVPELEKTFNYSGILNRIIAAGKRLALRGRFDFPEVVTRAIEAERLNSNPALTFIRQTVFTVPDSFLPNPHIYSQYREWCETQGYKTLANGTFGVELKAAFESLIKVGEVKAGKGKPLVGGGKDRPNGYWGLAYDPFGRESWEEGQKFKREQAERRRAQEEALEKEKQDRAEKLEKKRAENAERLEARRTSEEQRRKERDGKDPEQTIDEMLDGFEG